MKIKTKTFIANYDYMLLFTYFALITIGIFMQLNISSVRTTMNFFYRQFIWLFLSLGSLLFAFKVIDLEKLRKLILPILLVIIILLISVLIFGDTVKGAVRSIRIWKINIQPSLLARVILVFYFAHMLDKHKRKIALEAEDYLENLKEQDLRLRDLDTVRLEIIHYILKLIGKQ